MADAPQSDKVSTNTIFFVVIAVIVLGVGLWVALTIWGYEPIGPAKAKVFAEAFERECFLELRDEKECKRFIGEHHRECLFDNVERVEPGTGDDGSDYKHDRAGYMACMEQALEAWDDQ